MVSEAFLGLAPGPDAGSMKLKAAVMKKVHLGPAKNEGIRNIMYVQTHEGGFSTSVRRNDEKLGKYSTRRHTLVSRILRLNCRGGDGQIMTNCHVTTIGLLA